LELFENKSKGLIQIEQFAILAGIGVVFGKVGFGGYKYCNIFEMGQDTCKTQVKMYSTITCRMGRSLFGLGLMQIDPFFNFFTFSFPVTLPFDL